MTILEKKLIKLGYKQNGYDSTLYYKLIDFCYILCIYLDNKNNNIKRKFIYSHKFEIDLVDMENLVNQLNKDLGIIYYVN